jgi:hypothetical protein
VLNQEEGRIPNVLSTAVLLALGWSPFPLGGMLAVVFQECVGDGKSCALPERLGKDNKAWRFRVNVHRRTGRDRGVE